ncbi:hypothetical protein ACT80S_06470 [Ramlibacter sp. MAHUQ-53]|uniref:hypothetical protein n=1 Tax=unclassified Ramlibacter TaxID=2617605 RepID=UPI00362C071D
MQQTKQDRLKEKFRKRIEARIQALAAKGPSKAKPRVWADKKEDLVPFVLSKPAQ